MLEALVSKRRKSKDGISRPGDILAVGFPGTKWKHFLLAIADRVPSFDDPTLEAQLLDRRSRGELFPVVMSPYHQRNDKGRVIGPASRRHTLLGRLLHWWRSR